MATYLPESIRRQVAQRANNRCEYCLMPEAFLATFFHVDHIRSLKHGGSSVIDNLAYSCAHCNQHKGSDIGTFSDETDESFVRFFNPRKDAWTDHFELMGGEIVATTAIGLATVAVFNFNQPERVILRNELSELGQYPT
jgi:hypothetical protein